MVTAHFDHVGVSQGRIYPGADDNASGTAGLLGVARALVAYGPLRRSVLLLFVSGEEKGLWGSAVWTQRPVLPPEHGVVANLNVDMIGRTAPDELYITPTREHDAFNGVARAAYDLAALEGQLVTLTGRESNLECQHLEVLGLGASPAASLQTCGTPAIGCTLRFRVLGAATALLIATSACKGTS